MVALRTENIAICEELEAREPVKPSPIMPPGSTTDGAVGDATQTITTMAQVGLGLGGLTGRVSTAVIPKDKDPYINFSFAGGVRSGAVSGVVGGANGGGLAVEKGLFAQA